MCAGSDDEAGLNSLLRDPLIRLIMDSDGVTEQAMIALVEQVRRSLAARERQLGPVHKYCSGRLRAPAGQVTCPEGFQRLVGAPNCYSMLAGLGAVGPLTGLRRRVCSGRAARRGQFVLHHLGAVCKDCVTAPDRRTASQPLHDTVNFI